MIDNLNDLIAYSRRRAAARPERRERLSIDSPGCSQAEISVLMQSLPGLPDSYLSIARSLKLRGVAIGYFQLSPSAAPQKGLVDQLIERNEPSVMPMAKYYRAHGVYQVASWEADPIAVAHSSTTFKVGQVVKYNVDNPAGRPAVLADDFTQLLLIAGTLDEIRDSRGNDLTQAKAEFEAYLGPIIAGRKDDMASAWKTIADVVLS